MEKPDRTTMNGKPVLNVPAKSILNLESGFRHKLLCDGPAFSTGSACVYNCSFCYVPNLMAKSPHLQGVEQPHHEIVIRREGAIEALRIQLLGKGGIPRYKSERDTRICYSSPLVDVAANMELVRETIEVCRLILEYTNWQIRLLSKSNLLPKVAEALVDYDWKVRMIYGVSTGTFDDACATVFEEGCPKVSKRVQSLHWLQDNGFRTFGMLCPSLPKPADQYAGFAEAAYQTIRAERCEHVWAEVINVRGESMTRTVTALRDGGFPTVADLIQKVSTDKTAWEDYARRTFEAHAAQPYRAGQLRFLQYVTKDTKSYWEAQQMRGAILL